MRAGGCRRAAAHNAPAAAAAAAAAIAKRPPNAKGLRMADGAVDGTGAGPCGALTDAVRAPLGRRPRARPAVGRAARAAGAFGTGRAWAAAEATARDEGCPLAAAAIAHTTRAMTAAATALYRAPAAQRPGCTAAKGGCSVP